MPRPEFFDIFGALAFLVLTGLSSWSLWTGRAISGWPVKFILAVGVLGFVVDSLLVYKAYLKNGK